MPVFKLPPNRLLQVIKALQAHEFDRDGFREAVLDLFEGREEKSVFRGMALPTMRTLGLSIGFEQETRLSSDGFLAATVCAEDDSTCLVMQVLLNQIQSDKGLWPKGTDRLSDKALRDFLLKVDTAEGTPAGDFDDRFHRWVQYMEYFGLLHRLDGTIEKLEPKALARVFSDPNRFTQMFVSAFKSLSTGGIGEPVVNIEEIRRSVAIAAWEDAKKILLRHQFDSLLRAAIDSKSLTIHLHRSMGADEDLFEYKDISYQGVSITGN